MEYYSDVTLIMRKEDAIKMIPILQKRENNILSCADEITKAFNDSAVIFKFSGIKWYGTAVEELCQIVFDSNFPYYAIRIGEEDDDIEFYERTDGSDEQESAMQEWHESMYVVREVNIDGDGDSISLDDLALPKSISVESLI